MRDKSMTAAAAVADIEDGSVVMFGGFGGPGFPFHLREALVRRRPLDVTVVGNNGDFGDLTYPGGLRKLICSFPTGDSATPVLEAIERGDVELEVLPQGTLVERIRAAGAGLGGVLTPTGVGLEFGADARTIEVDGRNYLLATPLWADVALLRGHVADRLGNVVYRRAGRNFNPQMAMAGARTIVEVDRIVDVGALDPDHIHTPSVFVDGVVLRPEEAP